MICVSVFRWGLNFQITTTDVIKQRYEVVLCVVCVNSCCELVFLEDVVFWTLCARVGTLAVRLDSSGVHSSVVCIFSHTLYHVVNRAMIRQDSGSWLAC